jgi:AcrR family transcriptional regulator
MPEAVDHHVRRERAERILDAAADLLLHRGYRRVTVEDIAERADIGKGTVYLHWKTREALFLAVMRRESAAAIEDLVEALKSDPEAVTLHRLTHLQFSNVLARPLLRALYTSEPAVLGKLVSKLHESQDPRHYQAFDDYLRLLVEHGLLRDDLTIDELSRSYRAILHGFLLAPSPEPAARADLLADVVTRAFETSAAPDVVRQIAPRVIELFAETAEIDRAKVRRAYV